MADLKIGEKIDCAGFLTQEKYLKGQSLAEIENRLGFHSGRLRNGAIILKPIFLPSSSDFVLRGYSQVADHRFQSSGGFDENKLKQMAMGAWSLNGPDSLVKVIALIGHDIDMNQDDQYPPGSGVPQWKLIRPISFKIVEKILGYPSGKMS